MPEPTTAKDLRRLAQLIHRASIKLSILETNEGTTLDMGSRTNGRAFRLYVDGHAPHPACRGASGYLGQTKREAEWSLRLILDGLWLAQDLLDKQAKAK